MRSFIQIKTYFLSVTALILVTLSSTTSACSLFNWTGCSSTTAVPYCDSNDPASAKYCSLDRGTQIVSGNINDIEKTRKFSVFIQDIIAYLLMFLGIVGVIYIIYAGFNVLTAGGDEDKVKKGKSTIFHVFIGLVLIFLAYSIVKFFIGSGGVGGVLNNAFRLPSFIETTYAYTEYDLNTFDNYKKQIELLSSTLDREYQVNNEITAGTLTNLDSLVKASMTTFPDSDNNIFNTNLANALITAIEVVKKTPDSNTAITNLAKNLNAYLTTVKVGRIKGKITASPETGNAPLTVTLRASEVVDPSGVTIPKENYIWWIRTSGGQRSVLGTGPSVVHTFSEERTYTVFLNILSASRNKNGKTDVLPFDSSLNVHVLPKLGNLSLSINGVYVSHLDKIKFSPAQGRQGLLIDATASTPASGTRFTSTRFEFGNGNISQYNNAPSIDRQIYSNEGIYRLKMEVITNENQKITKEIEIEIRDPISSIRSDKTNGFPRDEFHFSASSSATYSNLGYSWQIAELESGKILTTSNLQNIAYKFPRTGKYAVKLKTLASNGKEDYDTVVINIEGRDPVVNFEARSMNSESPNILLLDATKSYDPDNLDASNLTYSWIIDGVRTDLSNPTRNGAMGRYTFDTVGTHRIALEVSNKEGKTISANKDISVDSLLSIKLLTSPKIARAGSAVSLIADSKEAQIFEWQFGDGETDTSTTGRMNHVYKKAGTYSVSVTVRGRNSDSNSISRKVYVMDSTAPFAVIALKRDNEEIIPTLDACDGKEAFVIDRAKAITLTADSSVNTDGTNQGIAYTWKYGGNRNSSQKEFSYKFDELGCFPLTLTVRSQKTGAQNMTRAYVKVENLAPKVSSLSVASDKLDADPVTVTVTANNAIDEDGIISSYIWYYYTAEDPEPQDFRITRSPKTVFVLPRVGAKYYFAVILEDSNGLKVNSEDMSAERYSLTLTSDNINTPIITLKASSASVSVGQKVDFTATAKNILGADLAGKAEYKWDYNGDGFYEETTNTPTVSHAYEVPGNFNFKVKVTYKGISNTKYQAIAVKNEIRPNLEYIAIGKKFVFLNTTKGLYTKVKWSLGDVTSTTPDSFTYDFGEDAVSGEVTLEVSDGTDTKSTSATLRKDVVNALKAKKATERLIYFSYPSADNDTVHITDRSEKLYIYLGESVGTIAKYGIDTDVLVDSNLNGEGADDIDNKGTDSFANGSVFALKNSSESAKERTMRLALYDANNTVIATKDLKVVYDFVEAVDMESLSGSLSETVSKDISEADAINLEKLKDLIRTSKEQDRLKMMQYFSALQENWFDTREKTKTIIDFENYIDTNSALDAPAKEAFYSLLEGFLLSDTQVKDDIGLATKVLKSLIPKTNPSYADIMKKIDEIIAHPTNTALNKELGTFILEAIKNDTTIEVKDKNIIKSQLQVIIYGGQNNIPENAPAIESESSSSSGILGFILGFGKILGLIILGIFGLIITTFVYFKISNKDENIGFQDFIIDRISGKTPAHPTSSSYEGAPIQKEERPQMDVLANIASTPRETSSENTQSQEVSPELVSEVSTPSVTESATIPDWLKESTSLVSSAETVEPPSTPPESLPEESTESEIPSLSLEEKTPSLEETRESPSSTDSGIPDWLKGAESIVPENSTPEPLPSEEENIPEKQEEMVTENAETTPSLNTDTEGLPAWMRGVDQESLKSEVEEEMNTLPETTPIAVSSDLEDIPDWLKSVSSVTVDSNTEAKEETLDTPLVERTETEEKQVAPIKKPSKK